MRNAARLLVAAFFAASVAACGGGANDRDASGTAGTPGAAGTAGTGSEASALDMGERNFVQDMLKDGQKEVQLGQVAQQRATSPEVKTFGEMMSQDHSKAGEELKQIAQKNNVQLDSDDDEARDLQERLSKLSGPEFDREYIDEMVKDHENAVEKAQDQAQNAENAQVRQWAANTLPKLKQHLSRAQEIKKQLDSSNRTNR